MTDDKQLVLFTWRFFGADEDDFSEITIPAGDDPNKHIERFIRRVHEECGVNFSDEDPSYFFINGPVVFPPGVTYESWG